MTSTHPVALGDLPDDTCLTLARTGDSEAYAELFRRHHEPALRAARAIAGPATAEDLTAEAFARVWRLLTNGGGPRDGFRAYLVTVIRNAHIDGLRRDSRLLPLEHPAVPDPDQRVDEIDVLLESGLVTEAFASLPARWREVLWLTTVEGRSVAEVADLLGLRTGAVQQLGYRAREALRLAYLSRHAADPVAEDCRALGPLLAQRARGSLSGRQLPLRRVEAHLTDCRPCHAAADELAGVAEHLPRRGLVRSRAQQSRSA